MFHQAALASVPRSVEAPLATNAACVTGTVNLLDVARQSGVRRVVYGGSSSAYGDQPTPAKHERLLPMPLSPYAAAKLAGEYYMPGVHRHVRAGDGDDPLLQRIWSTAGPEEPVRGRHSEIHHARCWPASGRRSSATVSQSRDFTYIDNVIQGNLLAAEAPNAVGQTINVACGESFNLLQLVEGINRDARHATCKPIFEPARAATCATAWPISRSPRNFSVRTRQSASTKA